MKQYLSSIIKTITMIGLIRYLFKTSSSSTAIFLLILITVYCTTLAYEAYIAIRLLNKNAIAYNSKPILFLMGYILGIVLLMTLLFYLKVNQYLGV